MKNIKIDIDINGYLEIQRHAELDGLSVHEYIKRALVLMMNIDDASTNPNSRITVIENDVEKLSITRTIINNIK